MSCSMENFTAPLRPATLEIELLEEEIRGALRRTWLLLGLLSLAGLGAVIYSLGHSLAR